MKNYLIILSVMLLLSVSCSGNRHFLKEAGYRQQVFKDFQEKQSFFEDKSIMNWSSGDIKENEDEAMKFLYAYMPVSDIADNSPEFFLKNIRASFKAREEMSWGKNIPDIIFRHFVLPIRVNNENLDESRMLFYEELKGRVKNLSMEEAAIEVNHWCHEKVVYKPTDARTISPLACVKTAYGRCGEESTFTVAALRSVGLPARQVYTPRWAHTDDNHAWVEVWIDGKWYFMGACEPEPVLNKGWFNDAAYRAMLIHTNVFGAYNGPEEIIKRTKNYTEINVIENYAPTGKVKITVTDKNGSPVENAKVEYMIYNYAEFYPVAVKRTDKSGFSSLTAGKGDLLIWASKGGKFGFKKVSVGKDTEINVILEYSVGDSFEKEFDIIPPVEGTIKTKITEEQIKENARRLEEEDAIRGKYEKTFCSAQKAESLAEELGLSVKSVVKIMTDSRGNHDEIEKFLRQTDKSLLPEAMELLQTVAEKDLKDTKAEVFTDHLQAVPKDADYEIFIKYVMNPRIAYELITPYKSSIRKILGEELLNRFKENPTLISSYIKDNIKNSDLYNTTKIKCSPAGALRTKSADSGSRDILYVAIARTAGIPARIEATTGKLQYYSDKEWVDVDFNSNVEKVSEKGNLEISYTPSKTLPDPKYYSHFTLAKINEEGSPNTLNFEYGTDGITGDTWKALFARPMKTDTGAYIMVTGSRMSSGKVLARVVSFNVEKGKSSKAGMIMRYSATDIRVIGNMDPEIKFRKTDNLESSILSVTGRGYFVIGIIGSHHEPSTHALNDIAAFAGDFEKWGRKIILLFRDKESADKFKPELLTNSLPQTVIFGVDEGGKIESMLAEGTNLSSKSLPIICICDSFGRITFVRQGYSIGLGEQLLQTINKL